jgi:CubicO group peptidase (beta-lactamase class C family)
MLNAHQSVNQSGFRCLSMRARIAAYGGVGLLLLLGLAYLVTLLIRVPAPPTLVELGLEWRPPSQSYLYFDSAPVAPAVRPLVLPEQPLALAPQVAWRHGEKISLAQFLQATHTNALLVLQHGRLVLEQYPQGANRATIFPSYSLAKSMLSDLVGVAVQEGRIGSLDDPVRKYLPELPQEFATLKIDDLLNMRSGIQFDEKYESVFSQIAYMYITTDLPRLVRTLDPGGFNPNEGFVYRSIDYQLLGMVLTAATGESLAHYLQTRLWQPMGAQYAATWNVDSKASAVEKGFCCINARAIDFARYGLLHLRQGQANAAQVLPAAWMTRPAQAGIADADFAYGRGWWLPRRASNGRDYTAIGVHGQFVYIDPVSDTVIVKLSDHGFIEDEAITIAAFRSIIEALPPSD